MVVWGATAEGAPTGSHPRPVFSTALVEAGTAGRVETVVAAATRAVAGTAVTEANSSSMDLTTSAPPWWASWSRVPPALNADPPEPQVLEVARVVAERWDVVAGIAVAEMAVVVDRHVVTARYRRNPSHGAQRRGWSFASSIPSAVSKEHLAQGRGVPTAGELNRRAGEDPVIVRQYPDGTLSFTIRNTRVLTKPIAKEPYIRRVKRNGPHLIAA